MTEERGSMEAGPPRHRPFDDAGEARLDRALDRLLAAAPEPELPADLARRILAASARIPQVPATGGGPLPSTVPMRPRAAARPRVWFERPRAVAAAFAVVAMAGFAAGWVEPLVVGDAQALDIAPLVFGSELEIDL
ncbi:hypothetical protein STVA_12800 [Allostella vacuolata]|nr:hypothetical protein STVA_12800 [Stella vacuolata]